MQRPIFHALIILSLLPVMLYAGNGSVNPDHIWLRFQPGYTPSSMFNLLDLPYGGHIERQLLLPEQSLRYNTHALLVAPAGNLAEMLRAEEPLLRTVVVGYDGSLPPGEYCALLMKRFPAVEIATPIYRNRTQYTPNDPLLSQQSYLTAMAVKEAWDISFGDSTLIIGVIDSGVRTSHEDLQNSAVINSGEIPNNGKDDDANGYVDDYKGYNFTFAEDGVAPDNVFHPIDSHGTCATGIIASTGNNNKGICGVAGRCKFLPIKAEKNSLSGYVDFGYESIIYAAVRGCKVLNCSWGNDTQPFNPLEQSIIDFAISRNVAIVASAGNHNGDPTDPFYPANYRGVLSVGETDFAGTRTSSSSYGAHCSVMAPGAGAITTNSFGDSQYTTFDGTSSAAPMASGVVALVRSKYPELTALQALEHVRQCTRSVAEQNPGLEQYLPGTVNARKALEIAPFSTPSIRLHSYTLTTTSGRTIQSGHFGDTIDVSFSAKNYLGEGSNLKFLLTILEPTGEESIAVLSSTVQKASVSRNEEFTVATFRIYLKETKYRRVFFRVAISGKGAQNDDYNDIALLEFFPARDFVTLRNNRMAFSVGDFGWLGTNRGSASALKGVGFSSSPFGNMLYRGGLMITQASQSKVNTGIASDVMNGFNELDFVGSEQSSSSYVLRLSDVNKSQEERIGVEVTQIFALPQESETVARVDLRITNKTSQPLSDIALGYFLDWDITQLGDSSRVRLFPEAGLPLSSVHSAAEMAERTSRDAVVGAAALISAGEGLAQVAGMDANFLAGNFPDEKKIQSLNSGTSIQTDKMGDISMAVGVKYNVALQPEQARICRICFGSADSAAQLAERLKQCLLAAPVRVSGGGIAEEGFSLSAASTPSGDNVIITLQATTESDADVEIYDIVGNRLFYSRVHLADGTTRLPVASDDFSSGMYIVRATTSYASTSATFALVR